MGYLFLVVSLVWAIALFQQLWRMLTAGQGSPLNVYGLMCGIGYFGSLGALLYLRYDRILWPKILVISEGMYSLFFLGYVVASPTQGLALRVADLTFGFLLLLQVLSAVLFVPVVYERGSIYIIIGLYILAVNSQSVPWLSMIGLTILFLFLSDVEYGWTNKG